MGKLWTRLYKSLQILINDFHDVTGKFLQILLSNMIMSIIVLGIFVMVRFHGRLEVGSIIVFCGGEAFSLTFILVTYLKFGEINESSKLVLNSWIRFQGFESGKDRTLMIKYIHCFQILRIHCGTFGYYEKHDTLRIIGKVVYYTAKFLLMTKQFK